MCIRDRYDIIRQNFLVGNTGSMTEEERQANISLGMKKAEYAAENFISEDSRKSFLEAMESVSYTHLDVYKRQGKISHRADKERFMEGRGKPDDKKTKCTAAKGNCNLW